MKSIKLSVIAINCVGLGELAKAVDQRVPGVYSVELVAGVPANQLASAALDVFHSSVPVGMPDDFRFYVTDSSGRVLAENPAHDEYSGNRYAIDVNKESDLVPYFFTVEVQARSEYEVSGLGVVTIAAHDQAAAEAKARDLLWDARLEAAGCYPVYHTTEV